MLNNKGKLIEISRIAKENGLGTLVAVHNDVEGVWYYYVGEFRPKSPSSNIFFNYMNGVNINYIIDNSHVYFAGENAKNELISTKIHDSPKENIEFDFRFVWFK